MSEKETSQSAPVTVRGIVVALVFGAVALLIVLGGLTVPIPGTGVVTDPREIFTTIGAGLSGPVAAILVGILAGVAEPDGIALASLLAHITGAIWMGFAYKKLVHERLKMPLRLLGWAALVLVYYYVFAITGFAVGLGLFHRAVVGESYSILETYIELAKGVIPEALLTTLITTLVMVALPEKYRKPLW